MRFTSWLVTACLQLVASAACAAVIQDFGLAAGCLASAYGITAAPNGDIWYTCPNNLNLVRLRYSGPQGAVSVERFPIAQSEIGNQLGVSSDGLVWIASSTGVYRYNPTSGSAFKFAYPAGVMTGEALAIGFDDTVWFSTYNGYVGRILPGGTLAAFKVPGSSRITDAAVAPDGNAWFSDEVTTLLTRATPQGVVTRFDIGMESDGVTVGPDGNIWVSGISNVVKVSPTGQVLGKYPTGGGLAFGIRTAPDGTMWFADQAGYVGQITIAGNVSLAPVPQPAGAVIGIAIRRSDGMVFYMTNAGVSGNAARIGAVLPAAQTPADTTIIEFFNAPLDHYFITGFALEAQAIDNGAAGSGWSRTGKTWKGWLSGPIPNAAEVCRFYGSIEIDPATGQRRGPNSHFYTLEPAECAAVQKDVGWTYEPGNRFWLVKPLSNPTRCAAGFVPVYRAYNNRFAQNDSNHRYAVDIAIYNQMLAAGWSGEGIVMCAVA